MGFGSIPTPDALHQVDDRLKCAQMRFLTITSVQPIKVHIRQSVSGSVFSSAIYLRVNCSILQRMQRIIQLSLRILLFAVVLLSLQRELHAQTIRPPTPPTSMSAEKSSPGSDDQAPTALDDELRAKRAIRYAEKEHQENLTRARDASDLGRELATSFKKKQALNSDDMKKLEKLEKLTKKIRSEAGASEDEVVLEEKPGDLAAAVESVAKVSSSLSERVLKTPRRVVSTSIIEEANVLLELIRIVRTFAR